MADLVEFDSEVLAGAPQVRLSRRALITGIAAGTVFPFISIISSFPVFSIFSVFPVFPIFPLFSVFSLFSGFLTVFLFLLFVARHPSF